MKRQKSLSWQVLGGLAMIIALVSMACSLSVGAPDFSPFEPTFTPQEPAPPLPTLPPRTNNPSGSSLNTPVPTAENGGQIPQTGSQATLPAVQPPAQPPTNLADLYDHANPGTVSILIGVQRMGQVGQGAGSGFVLSEDGYIATNYHVAADASALIVRFYNDVDARAELIGGDPDSDLAIIKVESLPEGVTPLPLGDSNAVRVGESVVAIGNPFGLGTSMSYGIVSAIGRTIPSLSQSYNIPQAIQTDAAINPGNSGGPLINMAGEVIGINAQIRTSGGGEGNIGIGFAIPVNILKLIYPELSQNGTYTWPYLGVGSAPAEPLAVNQDQPQTTRGAVISDVVPGGPAANAGLRAGDIVTSADGQPITSFDTLLTYIMTRRPGDQIQLVVLRNNQEGQVTVTLGKRPRNDNLNQ